MPPPGVGSGVTGGLVLGAGDGVELEFRVAAGPEARCAAASKRMGRCAGCLACVPVRPGRTS
jgi:hypothetical protein